MRVAIYARVSTDEQTTENQVFELEKVAKRMGWTVTEVYADTISGAKAKRPELDKLLKSAMRKEIDVVMAWSVDRLGRSLQHLITLLSDIQSKNVDLYLHQQGIDTTTPSGKMMFQMCGAFAEFERGMIRERVIAGQTRAKAQGKHIGRPSNLNDGLIHSIKYMREQGVGIRRIVKDLKVGVSTVYKVLEAA